MSEFKRLKAMQINDHIWLFNDNNEATGYLVTGSERAVIIDTMCGYENVRELAQSITELPLTVINTHGHPDHVYGNVYFEEAYIHPADIEIANKFYQHPEFQKAASSFGLKPAKFIPITEGEVINLGGIQLQVFELSGHTPGGIVLLDKNDRILFTGDSILAQTWMQVPEALPMKQFLSSLQKIQSIRSEFDYILTGHSREIEDASLYEHQIRAVQEVCEENNENDVEYTWFGGTCMAHPYGEEPRKIVYQKENI